MRARANHVLTARLGGDNAGYRPGVAARTRRVRGYDGVGMTDDELRVLMRLAQDGDARAYSMLLHEVAPRVRRLVQRRRAFLPPETIEDLVQDVLLSLHSARATFDPARPFLPWLTAILRHRLADAARSHARHGAHEVGVEDLDVTFPAAATNSRIEHDESAELQRAIEQLSPRQRQAIELLKLKEMSLKEAAAATGLTVGALKLATHRAMASLRRVLRTADRHGH